jgi:hypothetical protein
MPAETTTTVLDALAPHAERTGYRVPLKTNIHLLSGRIVSDVAGMYLRFPRWAGAPFVDDFGKKAGAMVEMDGEHLMPELAVLRLLQKQGWEGRWVSTYSAKGEVWKYLTEWSDVPRDQQRTRNIEEEEPRRLLAKIASKSVKRYAGCWDIFAWKDGQYAFVQTKRSAPGAADEVGKLQVDWLHTSLLFGDSRLTPDSFVFVQWGYE